MSIPVVILFVVFFVVLGPLFLYWFSRRAKELLSRPPSFIGMPQDGRPDQHG
jgi:membrane protein DedA with SNARE-associated domain